MSSTFGKTQINGIDVDALTQPMKAIAVDPAKGRTYWQVTSRRRDGTRSDSSAMAFYQERHQNVACFPELVSAFGERAFSAYWH